MIPFLPPPGIVSDDTTFNDEGRWADGSNVRFRLGKPETIGGWTAGTTNVGAAVRNMHQWTTTAGTARIAYGTAATLKYSNGTGGAATDITPAPAPSGVNYWSLQNWGDYLLAAPFGGKLYEWTGTGVATHVTQAPSQINVMLVTAERQVMALGCNEETSGTFNGRCIRWCDIEDYTNWTTASNNNAGEYILEGTSSVVAAVRVGTFIAIFTESALYIAQFIGDPGQTFQIDKVGETIGPAQKNVVAVMSNVLYWVGNDKRWRRWVPGGPIEEMNCPVIRDFEDNLSTTYGSTVVLAPMYRHNEVWCFYPDTRDSATNPSRYIVWSEREQCWFRGSLARTAMIDTLNGGVAMTDSSGQVYVHELTTSGPDTWFIQSADYYFDESRRGLMLRGCVPDFEAQTGDVTMTLYSKDRPQGSQTTHGPYTLSTTDTKEDFRASGRLFQVKFAGTASKMRLGKPLFDVVVTGER